MTKRQFIEKLYACGWENPNDASVERIGKLFEELFPEYAQIEELQNELDKSDAALLDIGDFAHARSTGPGLPDDLWEVRKMAYRG
jgi:hypothetical protein